MYKYLAFKLLHCAMPYKTQHPIITQAITYAMTGSIPSLNMPPAGTTKNTKNTAQTEHPHLTMDRGSACSSDTACTGTTKWPSTASKTTSGNKCTGAGGGCI